MADCEAEFSRPGWRKSHPARCPVIADDAERFEFDEHFWGHNLPGRCGLTEPDERVTLSRS